MGSINIGKAATLNELLHASIDTIDNEGEMTNSQVPRMVLLMHRWYLPSTELAGKLLLMYREATGEDCDAFRLKICHLMRYWISEFPAEFNLDLGLVRLTEEFRELASQLGCEEHSKLIDISSIPSYDWMRRVTQRKKASKKKGKASLLFDHLEPLELAEHLSFLEYKSFRRISFTDYQSYVTHRCLMDNPTLERSIALFNGISQWLQLMVLSKQTPVQRAEVITKFINVAQNLLQLQNFNTLMAVVGGLSHSAISRLKETCSHLAPEVTKVWNEMTELVSSNGNYCNYRKAFAECEGFKIPILGVHLKDLIAVHVAFSDWIDDNKVNIVKMQQLYVTFNELVSLQDANPHLEPNMDLIHLLTLSLDLYYTEDEIYELSLLREPRNPKSTPSTPTTPNKHVALVDWAPGLTPKPDPTVINKHIRKMVDSVFRNYDHDHDGYISQENFESITANFPFLDSFCVLDKDQDGRISKDEMMAYFLRANSQLQCKMGQGFIHNFQEMTYLKPTFCEHCAGFLWGLIKQGYKCKAQDGAVFNFPQSSRNQAVDGRSITLMTGSAQKISVRLQRATASQATQTEPLWHESGWAAGDSGSHTFPKMKSKFQGKEGKDRGFAKWENEKPSMCAKTEEEHEPLQNGTDTDEEQ
ncbi:ras guanyl-releasing protein 3 isoform X2 [Chiloscyllium plagiosum]|uniref:ras guanyl-releasing protein 3 isoform X2 n=1 Tax=Chiloscyllium plagiosum TaxID=36176 RepID=UPI001CB7B882|nr:ras guanyl-releasing protein 3 isoform X2 [Chiloscyllium plagiosum]